jgi:hypothetical protein
MMIFTKKCLCFNFQGFVIHGQEIEICLLKRTLHGLKYTPCVLYKKIDAYLQEQGLHYRNQCMLITSSILPSRRQKFLDSHLLC